MPGKNVKSAAHDLRKLFDQFEDDVDKSTEQLGAAELDEAIEQLEHITFSLAARIDRLRVQKSDTADREEEGRRISEKRARKGGGER